MAATRLSELLPEAVSAAEVTGDEAVDALLPEEEAWLGDVVASRRRDFTAGRACARRALEGLGVRTGALLPGPDRAPVWPAGVAGSITHCSGYCAAAVARTAEIASLGIDAEPHDRLPEGLLRRVATDGERARLDSLGDGAWDRVLFSAKESVFKAWHPLTARWLEFDDVEVWLDPEAGTFEARIGVEPATLDGRVVDRFGGRLAIAGGLILTAVIVPRAA